MNHKITKKNNELHVDIELDLRQTPKDAYVNYNTGNVVDLLKSEGKWQDDLICIGEAYVDNSDSAALTGRWTFVQNVPAPHMVEKKKAKPAAKKVPKKTSVQKAHVVSEEKATSTARKKNKEG